MASPFLHAIIFMRGAETISFDSILNDGFLTMNVHTSSHKRYVRRLPWNMEQLVRDHSFQNQKQTSLERSLVLHLLHHSVRKRLVKLQENSWSVLVH